MIVCANTTGGSVFHQTAARTCMKLRTYVQATLLGSAAFIRPTVPGNKQWKVSMRKPFISFHIPPCRQMHPPLISMLSLAKLLITFPCLVITKNEDNLWRCYICIFIELTYWLEGSYGIPRDEFGCPTNPNVRWLETRAEIRIPDTVTASNDFHPIRNVPGPLEDKQANLYSCVQTEEVVSEDDARRQRSWPPGSYCVYQVGKSCPRGKKTLNNIFFIS